MIRLNRQTLLILGLFLLLVVTAIVRGDVATERRFDPRSAGPDGLLVLWEWLEELEYTVSTTGQRRFSLTDTQHLLFIYPGEEPFSQNQADTVLAWVEAGGTAVLFGRSDLKLRQIFHFDSAPGYRSGTLGRFQPLLPEATEPLRGGGRLLDIADVPAAVPVLVEGTSDLSGTSNPETALAVLRQGDGWVWLVSDRFLLTNYDLAANHDQAQLLPAFLRAVPDGGSVVFDTYHLFGPDLLSGAARVESLQDWLYRTPTGWAAGFLLVLSAGWLVLSGKRLGPALETVTQGRRREAAEFVVAMAGLQRRAGVRDSIARHQRQRLKQALGKPWRLSPDLPDAEFLQQLRSLNPSLEQETAEEIAAILRELAEVPDEERLLALTQRIDARTNSSLRTRQG